MSKQNLNRRTNGRRNAESAMSNPVVLGGATFVLGFVAGVALRDAVGQIYERARRGWHHSGSTIVYDENLPASLARREPAPQPGQPRYGGTGAMGVSPRAVDATVGHTE